MHELSSPDPEWTRSRERWLHEGPRIRFGTLDADYGLAEDVSEPSPALPVTRASREAWLDAAVPDDALMAAAEHLRRTVLPQLDATWGITAVEGFHGYPVGRHEDLAVVAAVARGIAAHGPAFAAWAATQVDNINETHFAACFLGTYISVEAWAQRLGRDLDLLSLARSAVPESLRDYVHIDYDGMARDAWMHEQVRLIRRPRGGVWVFRVTD